MGLSGNLRYLLRGLLVASRDGQAYDANLPEIRRDTLSLQGLKVNPESNARPCFFSKFGSTDPAPHNSLQ
jgi:hypothetical protein